MGPRLFSRGKASDPSSRAASGRLQWGRDCSAAERTPQARVAETVHVASMGPRLFSRGKGVVRDAFVTGRIASMGPRLFSRGKYGRASSEHEGRIASMGPRLFSRGKHLIS